MNDETVPDLSPKALELLKEIVAGHAPPAFREYAFFGSSRREDVFDELLDRELVEADVVGEGWGDPILLVTESGYQCLAEHNEQAKRND